MTLAYFDCFAGAGGDMVAGCLLDAGADLSALEAALRRLDLTGYAISVETVNRGGLGAARFNVTVEDAEQPPRRLADILGIIDRAGLAPRAAERARRIFTRLAEAEGRVHRVSPEQVHFHEIGAVDSIVDIVGSCVALELLKVDRITCSPIPVGSGMIQSAHGALPVPAPATAQLLIGARTCQIDLPGELTTPTAAAILTSLAESYGGPPAMEISAVGYGAGRRDGGPVPNLLRVFLGLPTEAATVDTVVELSANIDDCTPELLGATIERLLSAGCADAWAVPIFMKRSRPAWMLSALCGVADAEAAEGIIFRETTTFGIRRRLCARSKLRRRFETVETPYGPIRIKVGTLGGQVVTASPEFGDCLAAARTHGLSLKEVMQAATSTYRKENR